MKTNCGELLVRKPEKHIRHLVLNAWDLPRHLAFDLTLETGSSVGNATSLTLLRHFLAFTTIQRGGQRTSSAISTLACLLCRVSVSVTDPRLDAGWCCPLSGRHRLVGLVVRRPPRERKVPGSNPACDGIFSGASHTCDSKIGTPVASLPGAWRYRVRAGTGRPGVSIL